MPVRSVQRCLEELEQRILELEQEPSTSDSEALTPTAEGGLPTELEPVCPWPLTPEALHSPANTHFAAGKGNTLIVTAISLHPGLHTPVYFFLTSLAVLDILCTSTVLPKLLESLAVKGGTISYRDA
ncbi:hypothetical protein AB1E18_018048 [Capra hircus]